MRGISSLAFTVCNKYGAAGAARQAMTRVSDDARHNHRCHAPRKAGYPVRRSSSVQAATLVEYRITRFRG
jgi:hypothetical protein